MCREVRIPWLILLKVYNLWVKRAAQKATCVSWAAFSAAVRGNTQSAANCQIHDDHRGGIRHYVNEVVCCPQTDHGVMEDGHG